MKAVEDAHPSVQRPPRAVSKLCAGAKVSTQTFECCLAARWPQPNSEAFQCRAYAQLLGLLGAGFGSQ